MNKLRRTNIPLSYDGRTALKRLVVKGIRLAVWTKIRINVVRFYTEIWVELTLLILYEFEPGPHQEIIKCRRILYRTQNVDYCVSSTMMVFHW